MRIDNNTKAHTKTMKHEGKHDGRRKGGRGEGERVGMLGQRGERKVNISLRKVA